MAGERETCHLCQDAIELDQIAIVKIDLGEHSREPGDAVASSAEIAVLACDAHLRRLALALEVLDAVERVERFIIPPLVNAAFLARVEVTPGRQS